MPEAVATPAPALERHRARFPSLARAAYFNYGAQGPLPSTASASIRDAFDRIDTLGTFSMETFVVSTRIERDLRGAFAGVLGTSPERIALVENITSACAGVLWGLDWRTGDRILVTDAEYPGVSALVEELARRHGLQVSICPVSGASSGEEAAARVAAAVDARVRLIVVSHVCWNSGLALPIDEIARQRDRRAPGALLLVDGAQAGGLVPVDVERSGADFYACTASKWLCGPAGVGALFVAEAAADRVRPVLRGWRGLLAGMNDPDCRAASLFEGGTASVPLQAGAAAAIAVHAEWGGIDAIASRTRMLAERLWSAIGGAAHVDARARLASGSPRPPETGIVAIRVAPGTARTVALALEAEGCLLKALPDPDMLRACVHYLTSDEEIDVLVAGLEAAVA